MSEKQFEIIDSDLRSLEKFPLKWRWMDERYNKLPLLFLNQTAPLSEEKAQEVWKIQNQYLTSGELDNRVIGNEEHLKTESSDRKRIQDWLKTRIGSEQNFIVVSWNRSLAVRTTTEVFCKYWDDFCYPASDDVVISSEVISWIIIYHHEEYLFFGKVREELI